jgi:hypothetical protein
MSQNFKKHPIYRIAKYLQNDSNRGLEVIGNQVWLVERSPASEGKICSCIWAPSYGMELESAIIPTCDSKTGENLDE